MFGIEFGAYSNATMACLAVYPRLDQVTSFQETSAEVSSVEMKTCFRNKSTRGPKFPVLSWSELGIV